MIELPRSAASADGSEPPESGGGASTARSDGPTDDVLTIGELARITGVSTRALRYYEQHGLISSTRQANNYRVFTRVAVQRVLHIQHFIAAGFCTTKILQLLAYTDGDQRQLEVQPGLLEELGVARRRLQQQRNDLDTAIERVDGLIAAAANSEPVPVEPPSARQPARGALNSRVSPPSY